MKSLRLVIHKTELVGVERELSRIADCLEHLIAITNPPALDFGPSDAIQRAFYTDEEKEIVRERLASMGKEYKERSV